MDITPTWKRFTATTPALERILDEHGWPDVSLVGEEGEAAAWIIAQHAISAPATQKKALVCLAGDREEDDDLRLSPQAGPLPNL